MMSDQLRFEFWRKRQEQLLEKIRVLVELETPSSSPEALEKGLRFLFKEWKPLTSHLELLHIRGNVRALYGYIKGEDDHDDILVLMHVDTVWPEGTGVERPFRIEGDRAYGPGIIDMKGGIALIWEWLEALNTTGLSPKNTIHFLVTSDEEVGTTHCLPLIREKAIGKKRVVIPEPPGENGALKLKRKGMMVAEFHIHGVPAHTGVEPWRGASAILESARMIQWLHALNPPGWATSIIVGTIQGGTRPNVVPDKCSFTVDVRTQKTEELERLKQLFQHLTPIDPRCEVQCRIVHERPPMNPSEEVLHFFEYLQSEMKKTGYVLQWVASGGGSDGNFTSALGIPTFDGMGPEGAHPHAPDEYIVISTLPYRLYLVHCALTLHQEKSSSS